MCVCILVRIQNTLLKMLTCVFVILSLLYNKQEENDKNMR